MLTAKDGVMCLLRLLCLCLCALLGFAQLAAAETSAEAWARAEEAFNARKYAESLKLFKDYYSSLPACSGETECRETRARTLLRIGQSGLHSGKPEEARSYFGMILSSYNVNPNVSVEAQYNIGACLKEAGSLDEAIQSLDKAVADYPGDKGYPSAAILLKAECLALRRDYEDSINTYLGALSKYSDKKDVCRKARTGIVQTVMASGNSGGKAGEIAALDRALEDFKDDPEICANALFWKSKRQLESKFYLESADTLRKLIADYPASEERNEACVIVGENLLLARQEASALDHLTPLVSDTRFSHLERGRMTLFMGLAHRDDPAKAEEYYSKVIIDFGDTKFDREAYYLRAIARIETRRFSEAMEDIAMIKEPICWTHHATGRYWYAQGDYRKAAENFEKVIPSLPDPIDVPLDVPAYSLNYLQMCYRKLGETAKADAVKAQLDDFYARYVNVTPN